VLWQMLDNQEELAALNQQEYKIQLAFERGLFQTPWLTLYSQNPMLVMSRLYIVFIYSDSVIVDFKAYPECAFCLPKTSLECARVLSSRSNASVCSFGVFGCIPDTTVSELSKEGGHIVFSFRWEEFGEHDPHAAYAYIFGAPLLLAGYFAFKILMSSPQAKGGRDLQA